jgi:hypothetical protein
VRWLPLCTSLAILSILACGPPAELPTEDARPTPNHIELAAPEIQLLPFTVRMSKLAYVLDRPVTDPLFDELVQQRFALGDHEYARALRPDGRWSARKMGIWVKGLLPLCESNRFAELYPAVATSPDALVYRAYGRLMDMTERMLIFDILQSMDGNVDTAVCLALLSSLEFVAQ